MVDLLSASCRVALAALCHDLGKFSQRARVAVTCADKETHMQLYCPRTIEGAPTHQHAAYTALSFDVIESMAPSLVEGEQFPFENARELSQDTDSLVNCSAMHHCPHTFMQWILATADRVASGFEREAFDQYNLRPEKEDFYTARLLTLFEQIRFKESPAASDELHYVYPLKPLSAASIFPQRKTPLSRDQAIAEYADLWSEFTRAAQEAGSGESEIAMHRASWPLWLDHFDTLWLAYTSAIPSATAFGAKPDVSLYDHCKATAALAVALWRWHEANGRTDAEAVEAMRRRADWDEAKILLIQGDCFGIQDFIFSEGSSTNKKAAKILRGRSFYVSLLSELAALRVLDALALPSTSQVTNAAGKFLIVAPDTPQTRETLECVRKEINDWFVEHTFALSGLGLCWQSACCNDFVGGNFPQLQKRLLKQMDVLKHRRYALFGDEAPLVLKADYPQGVCDWNNRFPADRVAAGDDAAGQRSCALSRDQMNIGQWLTETSRVLVFKDDGTAPRQWKCSEVPVFGYRVAFAGECARQTQELARSGSLRRMWDITMPETDDEVLWHGCARRNISGFVARFSEDDLKHDERYDGSTCADGEELGRIKSFAHLACEDRLLEKDGNLHGVRALAVLKGDVDSLGRIFAEGLSSAPKDGARRQMTFAKMATLSRQMNGFFSLHLPCVCCRSFPNVYTVFAGGDDFFFVGPWKTTQRFVSTLRDDFERYATANPLVHFSAGLTICKPATMISTMAAMAEEALEASKSREGKNAVTIYGRTVSWENWLALQECTAELDDIRLRYGLSTGYLYGLFELVDLSEKEKDVPTASLWRSRFRYRTARFAEELRRAGRGDKQTISNALTDELYRNIERYRGAYRIALTNFFYTHRQ